MNLNREAWLQCLEALEVGLATREVVEQSSCFVFSEGRVVTFNDEIACQREFDAGFTGAVPADKLLTVLRKLPDTDLSVAIAEDEGAVLEIVGKAKRLGVRMQREINLPFAKVELPQKWRPLADGFVEAIARVYTCAGKGESSFWVQCVHLHPDYVEACDNYQISRSTFTTGLREEALVRAHAIKHITPLGMTEICQTTGWLHFRNPTGLIMSVRKYADQFPDTSPMLVTGGDPITLPKGLSEAADRAEIFSQDDPNNPQLRVTLKGGKLYVRGEGETGYYIETKSAAGYVGPDVSFMISPKLLASIVKANNECLISANRLCVVGSAFTYVTCLGVASEEE